eukprot:13203242-Ditylum_brightwellii.AAC.1
MDFKVPTNVKAYPIKAELITLLKLMQQVDAMLKVASTKEDSTWSDITKIPVGTVFEEAFQLQQVTFAKD